MVATMFEALRIGFGNFLSQISRMNTDLVFASLMFYLTGETEGREDLAFKQINRAKHFRNVSYPSPVGEGQGCKLRSKRLR
jgi:hypothetical protein